MGSTYFTRRKTIRKYKDEAIAFETIEEMVEEAANAPTTGGMQLYSVIATTDKSLKEQLSECHFGQPQVSNAPVVLTFCADLNRFIKWCESGNATPGYGNLQGFMTAVLDTIIVAQQFNTIAEMRGYGCCYLGTTTYTADAIARILRLPELVMPITTLTVGVPDDDSVKAERLPLKGIMHKEVYKDYTANDIKDIFSEKEELPVNKRYVAENGKTHLSQVFTDIRYTKSDFENTSESLYAFIKAQGFKFPS